MKKHISFLIFVFLFSLIHNSVQAQDLRFYTVETPSGNTTTVQVYVINSAATMENIVGFTVNLYYDNTESSLNSFDASPTTSLGWNKSEGTTPFVANSNASVLIGHTGFGTINVIDENIVGTNVDNATPILLLNITMDHTVGTVAASSFHLAATIENHPALEYVGNDFIGHPVITTLPGSFPVEFLSFEAEALLNRTSHLSWITASELNNQGFYIERAIGDSPQDQWQSLGFVSGNGSTSNSNEYQFTDPMPLDGENIYRLRQVDIDGVFSYSKLRSVWFKASFDIQVYPNPTADILHVRFEDQSKDKEAGYTLFDLAGRVLGTGELHIYEINPISLKHLPEGTYVLRIVHNGFVSSKNVVKR